MKIIFRLITVILALALSSVSCEKKKEPVPDVPLGQAMNQQAQAGRPQEEQSPAKIPDKAIDNAGNRPAAMPGRKTAPAEKPPAEETAGETARAKPDDKSDAKAAGINPHGVKQGDKQKHQVVIPEEIKNRWQAINLAITDKQTAKTQTVVVALGASYRIPGSELTIKAGDFIPDFKVDALSVTSVSNKPNNPAVNVTVSEGGKEIFNGWLFEKYPEVHAFKHKRYAVVLKEGVESSLKKEPSRNSKGKSVVKGKEK
jgi:hypothetical protein